MDENVTYHQMLVNRAKYLENEIAQLDLQRQQLEEEREVYRSDFKILADNEPFVVKLIQVANNTAYTLNALEVSIRNIQDTGSRYQLPGFSNYLEFNDTTSRAKELATKNDATIEYLTERARKFDELKSEIAKEIERIVDSIDINYEEREKLYQSLLNCYRDIQEVEHYL